MDRRHRGRPKVESIVETILKFEVIEVDIKFKDANLKDGHEIKLRLPNGLPLTGLIYIS